MATTVNARVYHRAYLATELTALVGASDGHTVIVEGHTTRGDGGGGAFVWDEDSATAANNGTVFGAGTGRWLRTDTRVLTPQMFGAVGNGTTNDTVAMQACLTAGTTIDLAGGSFRIYDLLTITTAGKRIIGPGTIIVDHAELGTGVSCIYVTGDRTVFSGVTFAPYTNPGVGNLVVDGSAFAVDINADDCEVSDCTFSQGLKNGVQSRESNAAFKFLRNKGTGLLSGSAQDSSDHYMLYLSDGENCEVSDNYGYGWAQMILTGLSTNHSTFSRNIGEQCANHLIYVSSGDYCSVSDNIGYGTYTDITVRGDHNQAVGNKIYGGVMSLTNRVVDTGNGKALNSALATGNMVACNRAGAYALAVYNRTSYDGAAVGITISGNTVECLAAVTYAVFCQFDTLADVSVTGNTVNTTEASPVDAIFVVPTANTTASALRTTVTGNTVGGASQSAIQVTGQNCVISNNSCLAAGGTGANSGCILAACDDSVIIGNVVETTNANITAINQKTGDYCIIGLNRMKVNGATYIALEANSTDVNNIKAA